MALKPAAKQKLAKAAKLLDARLQYSKHVPRPEHPRPQFYRQNWLNLNGTWQFEIDQSDTGLERGLLDRNLKRGITVPFAPESKLSGVEHVGYMEAVWYRRDIETPAEWAGQRILLHFGAVDHDATVWVNGNEVARHRGGFSPFTADLTQHVTAGKKATVVVRARDHKNATQARGKQATWEFNTHCHYTRTTGIWQTVWLEAVPRDAHIRRLTMTPQVASNSITIVASLSQNRAGSHLEYELRYEGAVVASAKIRADLDLAPSVTVNIPAEHVHLWAPGEPHLYEVTATLTTPAATDRVESYTALRSVAIDGNRVRINGQPVFQRLVLDQGYYPDGLMTAPSDAALIADIELGLAAGFNGARLHQKVFEERFLYHADRLGYLCWGEYGDWGVSGAGRPGHNQDPQIAFVSEWVTVLQRDINHPAIIGWCPLNETHQLQHDRITTLDDMTHALYEATKLADPSRPVIDASGYAHRVPHVDIYDSHSYEQNPRRFAKEQAGLAHGKPFTNHGPDAQPYSTPYAGQPFWVSEYGGIWWNATAAAAAKGQNLEASWGYGQSVKNLTEFYERFTGLTNVLLDNPDMFGYCYTQLTDVFQEQNGIYAFDRTPKFDTEKLRAVQQRRAASEK